MKYLRRQMHHCNGHSRKQENSPQPFTHPHGTGEGRRILHFWAISFNNNLQGQALITQLEIHMPTKCFWFWSLSHLNKSGYMHLQNKIFLFKHMLSRSMHTIISIKHFSETINIHTTVHNILLKDKNPRFWWLASSYRAFHPYYNLSYWTCCKNKVEKKTKNKRSLEILKWLCY